LLNLASADLDCHSDREGIQLISSRRQLFLTSVCLVLLSALCLVRAQDPVPQPSPANPASKVTGTESALNAANQLYRAGKFAAAVEAFKALTNSADPSALAFVGLVHAYLALKNPEQAAAAALEASKLAPNLDAVHVALGEVYFRQGKLAEAENEFTALANANSKEARAYLGLSRIYHAASYYRQAKLAIDRAHDLDPLDPDIQRLWIRTLTAAEQIRALQAFLEAHPDDDPEHRAGLLENLKFLQSSAGEDFHPCRLVTKPSQAEIKMDRFLQDANHIRGYGLNVKLNEASSRLLLDTGATGLLINRKLAEKAGIKPIADVTVRGIGDQVSPGAHRGFAQTIKIGNLEFKDCYVNVIDRGAVANEDGLIGADVFSEFLVELDYPREKILLSELPRRPEETGVSSLSQYHNRYVAPEMKNYTRVYRFGHMLLVYTRLNDLPGKLFLLDTGAFNNTISPSAAREATRVSADANTTVKGLNGAVKNVFRADELIFQFGHLRQKNLDVVAFDTTHLSNSIGVEVSGTLGFAMLRLLDIKIDYRDGLVDFSYDENRLVR